jgi:uncharacterized protein (DUF2141 family)
LNIRLFTLFLIFSFAHGAAQEYTLGLTVSGIEEIKGTLMVGIFDDAEKFKFKDNPVYEQQKAVNDTLMQVLFEGMKTGTYAIAVYHDQNNDRQLNTKKLGVPLEGVGFSGLSKSKIKPPDFLKASFILHKDTTITIPMRYP